MYKLISKFKSYIFVFILAISPISSKAQNPARMKPDTTLARIHLQKGDSLWANLQPKEAIIEKEKAADIYLKAGYQDLYWELKADISWGLHEFDPKLAKTTAYQVVNHILTNNQENAAALANIYITLGYLYNQQNELDSAFFFTKKGLDINLETQGIPISKLSTAYNTMGFVYQSRNQHDSALVFYEKALHTVLNSSEQYSNGFHNINNSYRKIAWVYLAKGEYEKALFYFHKVLVGRRYEFGPGSVPVASAFLELGRTFVLTQQADSSLLYLDKALAIFLPILGEDHYQIVKTYNIKARIYTDQGNYVQSLHYNIKAQEIQYKLTQDTNPVIISLYFNVGKNYGNLGDFDKALTYYHKGLETAINLYGYQHEKVAEGYLNIGKNYLIQGLYHKALDYHQKALAIIANKPIVDTHIPVVIHLGLARVYAGLNDIDLALKYYKKAIQIEQTGKSINPPKLNEIYLDMGRLFAKINQSNKAIIYFHQALPLLENNIKTVDAYLSLANAHYNLRQIDSAFVYIQRAFSYVQYNPTDYKHALKNIYQVKSNILFQEKEYTQALSYAQKAIKANLKTISETQDLLKAIQLDNTISPNAILAPMQLVALSLEQIYLQDSSSTQPLKKAFITYQKTDELMSQLRLSYDYEADQLEFAKKSYAIYLGAIRVSALLFKKTQDIKCKEAAFYFAEKSKAYLLYNSLLDANAREFAGIPANLLEQDRILKSKIAYFQKEVFQLQKDQVSHLRDSLFQYKLAYSQLIQSFEKNYPDYYQLKYSDQPTSVAQIQAGLNPEVGLLEYVIDEQKLYAFFIDQNQFLFKQINLEASDLRILKKYPAYLRQFNETKYINAASHLYSLLIQPFAENLAEKKHILFVNNGALHKIPMETLLTGQVDKNEVDFRNLPYLLKEYTTSYFPSATLAAFQQSQKPTLAEDFLGFAPVFKEGDSHGNILSVNRSITNLKGSDSSVVVNGQRFESLPYSENELRGIKELLAKTKHQSKIFLHAEATEEQFKAHVKYFRYVHLASHSWANETNGLLSYILFSQPDSVMYAQHIKTSNNLVKIEDGVLYANEMYSLDWNADLVVLSSCKSGLGEYVAGEGVLTFTRGLLYGGVQNILYSLWNVNDKATADLMVYFYQNHLEKQMSYAESLRAAKLALLQDSHRAFPYWWAAFTLLGNDN